MLLSQKIQEDEAEYRQQMEELDQLESPTANTPAPYTETVQPPSHLQPQAHINKKKRARNWTHDEVMTLINIWEQNEVLYNNVIHPNYYDNTVKNGDAMERMVALLAEQNTSLEINETN